jgi:hypothetical protein
MISRFTARLRGTFKAWRSLRASYEASRFQLCQEIARTGLGAID